MSQLSMLSLEEPPASPSQSLAFAKDWLTRGATCASRILLSLTATGPNGSFGKTCLVSCHRTEDGILAPSSGAWLNSGMGSHGECWTLSTCEWTVFQEQFPKYAGVSSLSEIVVIGDVPPQYYLSPKACVGILRRAAPRKKLPVILKTALEMVAGATGWALVSWMWGQQLLA